MTKGIIAGDFARWLHLEFFPMIVLVTFVLHAGLAIRLAFMRWQIWSKTTMIFLILILGSFLAFFSYIELYYQPIAQVQQTIQPSVNNDEYETEIDDDNFTAAPVPVQQTNTNSQTTQSTIAPTVKTFTLQELSKYNGQNGTPSYVAVDGVVYDLSRIFINGFHQGYYAGQDLTQVFHSQHITSILYKYPVVGKLAN